VKRSFDRRFTRSSSARRLLAGALAALALLPFAATAATEPASCRIVRFSDIGWTDVTATTGLASHLVRLLGYQPKVTVLSVPVTFASIKNGDIDVFLGNWMPAQAADLRPYQDDGSVEVVGANLEGAKYTLAVPAYLHEAGLRDFGDIRRFAGELEHQIYGIEPGNDGNRLVLDMIKSNEHGLGDFKLVESSEQGMLSQVERAIAAKRPIVFFGWEPHPMNTRFEMRYLTGGDSSFGPNYGGATVYTNVRAGYLEQCPNVGRLVRNLKFTLRAESEIMQGILDRKLTPEAAGEEWLRRNPGALGPWFEGVTTFDGQPAPLSLDAPTAAAAKRAGGFEAWVTAHKIPLGATVESAIEFIKANGRGFFAAVSAVIQGSVDGVNALLAAIPGLVLILAIAAVAWGLHRSIPLVVFVIAALLFIMNQGYWAATLETLSLVIVSALFSTLIGVPIGIAAAHRPRLFAALRPVLDLMQTLPTFVYLIPTLVLFGLGVVPGLISTVIFAVPAPIRLTHLGISSVPQTLLEAGDAFGATPMQRLWKIELPSARPTILAGITQCIMLSLSMVVIAALVGAGGLGVPVVRALNSVQVDIGFEAGIAIVLLAIILDRISRPGRGGPQE
jgi:glycine betaine/proline transport system substrate-binding protein